MNDIIKIYADWSCLWNPWPWWFAAILIYWDKTKTIKWSEKDTTNNRMELSAIIQALKSIKTNWIPINIFVDSQYVKTWITTHIDKWLINWRLTANKEPVKNKDLWIELYDLNKKLKPNWNWVRWHADDAINNLVDKIAKKEAKKQWTSTPMDIR